jgi:hypothetical protein
MDESLRPIQERIWLLEDEKEQLDIGKGLMQEYYSLTNNEVELRKEAIKGMSAENVLLYDQVQARKTAIANAQLYIQIMELQGDAAGALAAQRKIELAAMDASLRPMQNLVWALQDVDAAKSAYLSRLQEERDKLKSALDSAKSAYISGLESEISKLETAANDAKSDYLELLQDELDVQNSLVDSLKSAIESIKDYRDSLFELSATTPELRDALYKKQSGLAAQVTGGDIDAVSDLISVSGRYLDAAKSTSSSKLDYDREVAKTNVLMFNVQENLGEQLTEAEKQAVAFQELIDGVNGVDKQVKDIAEAKEIYDAAKTALDNNWYSSALDDCDETKDIGTLQKEYNEAKEAFDETWYDDEIEALEDVVLSIDELKAAYLAAEAAVPPIADAAGPAISRNLPVPKIDTLSPFDYSPEEWGARVIYESATGGVSTPVYNAAREALGYGDDSFAFMSGIGYNGDPDALRDRYGFSEGRILTGPVSGYGVDATFHGPEAIIPLDRLDHSALITEIRNLRKEVGQLREESKAHAVSLIKSSQKVERNTEKLDEWNEIGMPAEQAA